ncbi:CDP-diacylglycerol diphosphatase [Paraburkholderia phenazinium]|uniref:CDP-diacylglycerol pyrophosphatase n=1 Tax=Paraburkholderia phenazinium TaxID=60549 RepID=A0A1G8NXJ4_9BURK|nr:CDP-diacylglycerol diphosphatase [Paraburkholderia phenazinium]SDI84716.1 CDP-diacylglycerol pyrophosphatase [Paraburkholderia phenazinium]
MRGAHKASSAQSRPGNWFVIGRTAALVAVAVVASSCAQIAAADPDALWKIVGGQCVPEARASGRPGQCTSVNLAGHYAILKDISGRSQHLLIPTERVTGIESPSLLDANAPDYWADGWSSRNVVEASLKQPLKSDQFGLEINSEFRRSQQQLHIHMDCMRSDIINALAAYRQVPVGQWQWETIDDVRYRIMRVTSLSQDNDPFRIVARDHPDAQAMATQTILVTGAGPSADQDGWLVLNSGMDVQDGTGTAEGLLDHACRLADAH